MEPHTSSGSKSEDTLDGITYYSSSRTQKRLWVDRFFGLFCAKSFIHKENEKIKSCEALEVCYLVLFCNPLSCYHNIVLDEP